jgi:nitrite reductase/ring-hydroxylating ferredoxin subunit
MTERMRADGAEGRPEGEGGDAVRTGSAIDARLDEEERRGLTGTARGSVYEFTRDPDDVSRAPDRKDEFEPPQWRSDFPIDWPKDEFVARRDFAKFLVLTSCAFAAGQGWIAAQDLVRHRRIASKSEIPIGGTKTFSYPSDRDRCVLVRLGPEELVAFSQSCTHLSCAVIPKVDEGVFVCPCHEGFFDLRTGRNISGPPPRPLPRIVIETNGDDVYAVGVEERTAT